MSHELVSYLLWVFLIPYNGLGVFLSKLTELQVRSNRLALSGNVNIFQPYFTGPSAFDGILRKSWSSDVTEPIFPLEHAGELRIFVLRGEKVQLQATNTPPWTRTRDGVFNHTGLLQKREEEQEPDHHQIHTTSPTKPPGLSQGGKPHCTSRLP